jgi:predicted RNase H-like HicB family nuclease
MTKTYRLLQGSAQSNGLDKAKETGPADARRVSLPLRTRTRRRVHDHLPKVAPVVTYGETLEQAQANAREAIELCLEVMREEGQPIPPPDRDLASPIDQLVPVTAVDL